MKRKLIALLLALLMFFALALPASAENDHAANAKDFESERGEKTDTLPGGELLERGADSPASDASKSAGEKADEDVTVKAGQSTSASYTLEQVVVLSRHNLRAPLSSNGSVPADLTPHAWIKWSAGSSELTLKGGVEETSMGQYFKKWLAQECLIAENAVPEEGEVRFNARDKQRCRATARYFAAGMLPLADIDVEYPGGPYDTEDFMSPTLKYYSDAFAADATAQVASLGGSKGFEGLADETRDAVRLIMDTVDMPDSEAYKSGKYGDLLTDGSGYKMAAEKEPDVTGAIKTATQVADALVLQYYEEPDADKAAFGHELTEEDWAEVGGFLTTSLEMKHGAPLVALSVTHPLIQELKNELENESRKFSFFCAHDCTVLGTLSALGVEDYTLPGSIETKTPIGVKLLFERWRDGEGQAWYRVDLVYRSTEQIRSGEMLTLENPPLRYDLRFEGVETNEDGLIAEAELFGMFDRTLTAFDKLGAQYGQEVTIEGWEPSSPAMQSIVKFVEDSVDESSDAFIPKADRIAVFDMDGTLFGERFPTYFHDWLFIWRALHDESFKAPAYLKAFAKSWEEKVLSGIPIGNFDALERELGPKLYEGLTPDEYMEVVRTFKALPVRGFENMSYGEAYFQPMVSLVKYLYDHDYTIYIVSATYRDAVRVMTEGVLDEWIPFDHVIGTDLLYAASGDEEENSMFYEFKPDDELVITGRLFLKDQKTNKVTAIQREIGRVPVLAFGNSTGDFSMATYTLQNKKYGGRAYMLLCDDTERDYGDPAAAAAFQKKCDACGFYTVSMKDEFKTFYPEGVHIAEVLPDAA